MPRGTTSSALHAHAQASWDYEDYVEQGHFEQEALQLALRAQRAWHAATVDAYVLRVELKTMSKPTIWRKLRVPSDITFNKFHKVLQIVFGWGDEHMYTFDVYTRERDNLGMAELLMSIQDGESVHDARELREFMAEQGRAHFLVTNEELVSTNARLSRVFGKRTLMDRGVDVVYRYDLGDDWEHRIEFLGIAEPDLSSQLYNIGAKEGQHSFCIEAGGHGALEDCGGEMRWEDTKWEKAREGSLDPRYFDIVSINRRLDHMWVSLTPTTGQRLIREIRSDDAWNAKHSADLQESGERTAAIASDPDFLEAPRQEAHAPEL